MASTILPITIPDKQLPDPARRLSSGFVKANGRPAGLWLPSKLAKAAADFSGNGNFGTLNGGVTTSGSGWGMLGQSWNFPTGGYIPCGQAAFLANGKFSAHVVFNGSGGDTFQAICGVGGLDASFASYGSFFFYLRFNILHAVAISPTATVSDIAASSTNAEGVDIDAMMTYDGTNHRLYINGAQKASATFTDGLATSSLPFTIGRDSSLLGTDRFNGLIRLVDCYGSVFTAAQVSALYSSLLYGKPYRLFDQTASERFIGNVAATGGLLLARRRAAAA